MKNIKYSLLFVAMAGAAPLAQAQDHRMLAIEEAVELGIRNSKNLKIDDAGIERATANYLEVRNRQLPSLKVSGSALALANAEVDLKIAPKTAGAAPKATSAFFGSANFSLPIFAGGRIKYGIESAKYLIEAAKLSKENDKTAIAYNISQAYNNLFKANQAIKVLNENLAASQQRDQSFLKLENNGIIAKNDRLKANLQTSNIELQLLEAHNNYNIANINMDLLLGLPETTIIDIDQNYISETLPEKDLKYYFDKAIENRNDLKALSYQQKAAELGTKIAKAENLPTLALTAGYVAADVPKILTVYNAANIGVGIQYNIDNLWKKNSSILTAEARRNELSATGELLNDRIKLEVNTDFQNADYARRKISVYEKAAAQANENYRVVKNRYNNGLATITELLDADAAQISANVNVISAKADAALAYRKLLQTTGISNTNLK